LRATAYFHGFPDAVTNFNKKEKIYCSLKSILNMIPTGYFKSFNFLAETGDRHLSGGVDAWLCGVSAVCDIGQEVFKTAEHNGYVV